MYPTQDRGKQCKTSGRQDRSLKGDTSDLQHVTRHPCKEQKPLDLCSLFRIFADRRKVSPLPTSNYFSIWQRASSANLHADAEIIN